MYHSDRIHVATCGPIGTKFGKHMPVEWARYKLAPCDPGVNLGGFGGSEIQTSGKTTKRLNRLAPNLAHMFGFIWEWT